MITSGANLAVIQREEKTAYTGGKLFFVARDGEPIDNPGTSIGLDIFGAFGIAAALAIAGQLLL